MGNAWPRLALGALLAVALALTAAGSRLAQAAVLPTGFQETVVFSGLQEPTALEFASDGRIFVAEKSGIVKYFDGIGDTTPTIYADLRTNVHSFWDRGLLGLALHPSFPANPSIYVTYTYDAAIGGTAPRWGTPGASSDGCPTPPGANADGCVVSGRLSRLTPSGGGTPYANVVLADNPASYWRLGEASGASAADAVGGRNGTYRNGTVLGQAGALVGDTSTAVRFDGIDDDVLVPHAAALNPSRVTLEAWVKPQATGVNRTVVSKEGAYLSGQNGYGFRQRSDNTWWFVFGRDGDVDRVESTSTIVAGQWYHLVGTYDGSTLRLYVNGQLQGQAPSSRTTSSTQPLMLGRHPTAGEIWAGTLDEVAVYPAVLSGQAVLNHYAAGSSTGGGLAVEQVLIEDWCQQYPSMSIGGAIFGPDGALYVTGGPGGSFTFNDYGQDGTPVNPCGDPPGGVGGTMAPPTAEGGSLRSQDLRTSGDPVGLGGSVIRVDPATGAAMPNNPLSLNPDPNARRIVAYGLRNPFRSTFRPGTSELWIGDVGGGNFEEIDLMPSATDTVVDNYGWPCYEGAGRQLGWDPLDVNICENLYAEAGGHAAPYFSYAHADKVVPGETCPSGSSAVAGIAFAPSTGVPYPAQYAGALFFADNSRNCIWVAFKGANGRPDMSTRTTFVAGAASPVELQFGPDGKLWYVDHLGGTIRRIDFSGGNQPPTAVATANPTTGAAPLAVSFNGSGSSDPENGALTYAWDLDGDGQFDDSTAQSPSRTYAAGTYTVKLRVTDPQGLFDDSDPITISAGNEPPVATMTAPASTLTWKVGDTIAFSGTATDPQQGALPASAFSWQLIMHHCPSNCHTHTIQTFSGVASGSFVAPDHEYPSHLELRLTVTDAGGLTDVESVLLQPQTVQLSLTTVPSGLMVGFNTDAALTPFTRTVIRGSTNTISAASPQGLGGTTYSFAGWSDGGAQSHEVMANASATYTATYGEQQGSSYASTVLADAPRGYWRLGEASGTLAADGSGNGRTGTYVNGPTLAQAGALLGDSDTAVRTDGVNDAVSVPHNAALVPAQVSLEAWVKPAVGSVNRTIVSKEGAFQSGQSGYGLRQRSNGEFWFLLGADGSADRVETNTTLVAGQWYHVVGTYDGAALRLYLDGQLVGQAPSARVLSSTQPLTLGRHPTAGEFWNGTLDEVAVYPTALSAARVAAHFAAGRPSSSNQPPTAVAAGTPLAGAVPLTTSFNGSASSDPEGQPLTYAWDLDGDGAFDDSTAVSPSFTYTTAGTYTVKLRATDTGGASDVSDPLSVVVGASSAYRDVVLVDNPVGYWRLGETSGTTAGDASGNGRTGTYTNAPTLGALGALTGDPNTAVTLDGVNEFVSVAHAAALSPAQVSLEAWVKPAAAAANATILSKEGAYLSGQAGYGFRQRSNGEFWFVVGEDGSVDRVESPTPLAAGQWYHLVGTFDGATLRLYVNGTLVSEAPSSLAISSTQALTFGRHPAGEEFWNGTIDEVAVFGTVLSDSRVAAHYAAGRP